MAFGARTNRDTDWLGSEHGRQAAFDRVGGFTRPRGEVDPAAPRRRIPIVGDERLHSIHHGDPRRCERSFVERRRPDNLRVPPAVPSRGVSYPASSYRSCRGSRSSQWRLVQWLAGLRLDDVGSRCPLPAPYRPSRAGAGDDLNLDRPGFCGAPLVRFRQPSCDTARAIALVDGRLITGDEPDPVPRPEASGEPAVACKTILTGTKLRPPGFSPARFHPTPATACSPSTRAGTGTRLRRDHGASLPDHRIWPALRRTRANGGSTSSTPTTTRPMRLHGRSPAWTPSFRFRLRTDSPAGAGMNGSTMRSKNDCSPDSRA